MTTTHVTILGLGAMGLPMATHLATTFAVSAFDPDDARRSLAQASGATVHPSAREAADGASLVVLAVRDAEQMRQVLLDTHDGVVSVLAPGAAIVLTSTVGTAAVRALAAELDPLNVELVDAPVSGGPVRAGTGELLVMVGAREAGWRAAEAVITALGSTVTRVSAIPGDGQALKTVNQLLCGVHIAAAAEAIALARSLGLDLRATLDALSVGSGRSFMLDDRGERMLQLIDGEEPDVLSTVGIFVKDMGIVAEASRTAHVATPVASAAEQLFRIAERLGLERLDDSAVLHAIAPLTD